MKQHRKSDCTVRRLRQLSKGPEKASRLLHNISMTFLYENEGSPLSYGSRAILLTFKACRYIE